MDIGDQNEMNKGSNGYALAQLFEQFKISPGGTAELAEGEVGALGTYSKVDCLKLHLYDRGPWRSFVTVGHRA